MEPNEVALLDQLDAATRETASAHAEFIGHIPTESAGVLDLRKIWQDFVVTGTKGYFNRDSSFCPHLSPFPQPMWISAVNPLWIFCAQCFEEFRLIRRALNQVTGMDVCELCIEIAPPETLLERSFCIGPFIFVADACPACQHITS